MYIGYVIFLDATMILMLLKLTSFFCRIHTSTLTKLGLCNVRLLLTIHSICTNIYGSDSIIVY